VAKLDWEKANREDKVRDQGHLDCDDRLQSRPAPSAHGSSKKPEHNPHRTAKKKRNSAGGRIDLLNFVARSVAQGSFVEDKVPGSVTRTLSKEVEAKGGLVKWASAQSGYGKKLRRYRKRLARKAAKAALVAEPRHPIEKQETRPADRVKHLRKEIAAAEEFIRAARKEIERIESKTNIGR